MALNALRGRTSSQADEDAPLEIGSSDARIITCPVCSRPIVSDARRCPGCSTRLVMGVPARKAGVFAVTGTLLGLLVGAVVVGTAAVVLQVAQAAPPAATASDPVGSPAASGAPTRVDPAAPAAAVAALRQAVAINGRLASGVGALNATLSAKPFDSFAVASVLRSLAADAAIGSDAAARLRPWTSAAMTQAALTTLYDKVRATARSGLAAGLANQTAYRNAAKAMLKVLGGVGAADETARVFALSEGVALSDDIQ